MPLVFRDEKAGRAFAGSCAKAGGGGISQFWQKRHLIAAS